MSKEGTKIDLLTNVDENIAKRFYKQLVENKTDKAELLWIRNQREINKENSDWQNPDKDFRRRIVSGLDEYAIRESNDGLNFSNINPYLYEQIVLPQEENERYWLKLKKELIKSKWRKQADNDQYTYKNFVLTIKNDCDIGDKSSFPDNYIALEIEIKAQKRRVNMVKKNNRLNIVNKGIGQKDKRGDPTILDQDLKELEKYFPMQIELGCGPSVEAGIDPLHYFHSLYQVQNHETGKFNMGGDKNTLIFNVINNPELFFKKTGKLYTQALLAEPTPFYFLLQKLIDKGIIRGDIINNNFDGLCNRLSLQSHYIRRFEKENYYPKINFDSQVRSLLVVGSHADRRKVQFQARKKGLKIIYVDPEGFYEKNIFKKYKIESLQNGDILVRKTADEFTRIFRNSFSSICD